MNTITIDVETDRATAQIFRKASAKDRNKLVVLWELLVREFDASPSSLQKLMDEIGRKAEARGLTAGKLESILNVKQATVRS